jgi:hypothetical protein
MSSRVVEVELVLEPCVFTDAAFPEPYPVPRSEVLVYVALRSLPSITSKPPGHACVACE